MEINAANSGVNTASSSQFSDLSTQEFLKVLFTELQHQDPFEPQDSGALLEQLSSIRNIESQMSLQTTMENIVSQNQLASAGGLIGQQVTGLNSQNNQTTGLVSSVRVRDKDVLLELDNGHTVNMKQVLEINQGPAQPANANSPANIDTTPTVPGDTNGDGKVDGIDIATLSANLGRTQSDPNTPLQGDLNNDGRVDLGDVALLAQNGNQSN